MVPENYMAAVDPVTIVIKECINISTAMRKYSKFTSQSGVAALLGGGSDIFSNQDDSLADTFNNLSVNKKNDPLLSGFIQLRLMLNKLQSLEDIDSLTLLQPFLVVVSTSSISGYITSLALDSLQKFFTSNIVTEKSANHVIAYRETVNALTHCRFEASEQVSDDSVLLKVVNLILTIIQSPRGDLISDSIMYDVLQTVLSLACNKRRSEVLRRAAEFAMISITVKIFSKLKTIEPTKSQKYINDESYAKNELKDDVIGTTTVNETLEPGSNVEEQNGEDSKSIEANVGKKITKGEDKGSNYSEHIDDNYGLPVIKQYLNLLLSLVVPENQTKHTNSARIFGLQLIDTAIELSGDKFLLHPRLFSLVSDPIFKYVLFIIQNNNKLSLLQAALQLFTTLVIILGDHLPMQIELTFSRIFSILSPAPLKVGDEPKGRPAAVKELIIEQISILWTRFPSFFTSTFIEYDCNLERADISINFLTALKTLALPESALSTSDSVPPICLEGLICFVDDVYEHLQHIDKETFSGYKGNVPLLKQRERKTEFIRCSKAFNEKPKKGIPLLVEKGFIKSDNDPNVARFLFENNSRMNKKTIGLLLCDPKKTSLLKCFIDLFDFKGLRVDEAIRILLTKFRLPGESQQIERIIEAFSSRYAECQSVEGLTASADSDYEHVQPDSDSVFVLSYSIIMLNTDLHNPHIKEHMSFDDYSSNLRGCYNQKDFPFWYLDRIYCSIRDKEIVMPEEHHGNDRWFEDAWNNLISLTTVMTESAESTSSTIGKLNTMDLAQFDGAIFEQVGSYIVKTLFRIYNVASDDHISTRMLTSLDKCSFIAAFFNLEKLFTDILCRIAKITTLIDTEEDTHTSSVGHAEIPLVEIVVEDTDSKIIVSSDCVKLGRSFKGQLCMVVFFRILQRNTDGDLVHSKLWEVAIKMLLVLYENLLISPDIFPDLQQKLKLGTLPRPKPEVSIKKSKENKGILSAFASYLKGDEEPTDEEVEKSLKALQCIKSCNIASSLFGNKFNVNPALVNTLLNSIKVEKSVENERFYESEILFLIELSVSLFLFCKNEKELGQLVLNKIYEVSQSGSLSKQSIRRLMAYKLLLISVMEKEEKNLLQLINDELLGKNEVFTHQYFATPAGGEILTRILELTKIDNYRELLVQDEGFWKLLRSVVVIKEHTADVYQFLESSLKMSHSIETKENFMWILGLLDEISSIGAIGSQWEKKCAKKGVDEKENPYSGLVDLSIKSINLTSNVLKGGLNAFQPTKNDKIALIQALAHQCLNPCLQISSYSLETLEVALTKDIELPTAEITTVEELIEGGLLPLLGSSEVEDNKSIPVPEILSVISKIYLYHLKEGITTNDTFLRMLNIFNKYVDIPEVEKELQQLITEKKSIENCASSNDKIEKAEKVAAEVETERQEDRKGTSDGTL
ncbi:hypothetical protein HG535_0B03740 [Zygotorulaspora mrakii]|uniref:SEC7 domain-containing protein n=1 Tax=Zygotorulaspora mrakii TaxID=42260 RepID=A0A7H9AYX5_ZYGMR|nr:uncharacterized protein HG535_0B03740 [Zygotorulaspora mrakii]QLG71334.1 hypothetical protein HG535_0B03740 [Zygotorulaspora mrakii]